MGLGRSTETCAELGNAAREVAASLRTDLHALSAAIDSLERVGLQLEARGNEQYDAYVVYLDATTGTGREIGADLRRVTGDVHEIRELLERVR
jgi:hypothetical protein